MLGVQIDLKIQQLLTHKITTMNSNTFFRPIILALVLLSVFGFFVSCDNNNSSAEPDTAPDLLEVIQTDPDFSTLASVVEDLGLTEALTTQTLTVFAPTNAAFDAISDVIPTLTNEDLTAIVQYHLTGGAILSTDLAPSQDVEMLQGEETLIESGSSGVTINGSVQVVKPNLETTNGVIHGIDQILLPTEYRVALQGPSIVEVAEQAGNFTTLLSLVETAGLTTTLKFKGPFTVFPPSDAAFTALGEEIDLNALASDPAQVTNVLLYHVLSGEVLSTDLQAEQTVPSAYEEPLYITAGEQGVVVNGTANVVAADITDAANGVLHVVDSVLLPNEFQTIAGLVTKNYNLSTLLELVAQRPDVVALLNDPSLEFTVFAPTNEAIAAALEAYPDLTDQQITEILSYHVLTAAVLSSDLSDGQSVATFQGEEIVVSLGDGIQINSSNVITADLHGVNGVVHIIDSVLLPPSYTE